MLECMPSNVGSPSKLALPQFKKLKFIFEPKKLPLAYLDLLTSWQDAWETMTRIMLCDLFLWKQ